MVGKCIRKKDDKILNYKFIYEESEEFFVFEGSWKLIGNQNEFEKDYEFKDELVVAVVFNYLKRVPISTELYSRMLDRINGDRNYKDQSIAKMFKRFNSPKTISALCTEDVYSSDVNGNPNAKNKRFLCRNSYHGVFIRDAYDLDSHFLLIGEKISLKQWEVCFVNQKVVYSFSSGGNEFKDFKKKFFLMNPNEPKEDAWRRYQVIIATDRFDL
jgi:hypothetical protein